MRYVPVLALSVTALALYASRTVLDQIVTADGLVRVALLPPWQSIGGFFAVGGLGLLWLDRRRIPRASATAVRPPLGPLLLPLLALAILLLPYLPFVADIVAPLQILAGPIRTVVWIVTLAQLGWVLWQVRLVRADWLQHASVRQLALAASVVTALLAGAAALRLTNTVLYPSGDEPHYLVIAQSLWRDGDLEIENNHTRGDYREYFSRDLDPHYLRRGTDGQIYSVHPVGMPVLIAPIYALGGYPAVVMAFIVMAAAAAGLTWLMLMGMTNNAGAATFAWASVAATSPFLFNVFGVYPEIPAALAVTGAFYLMTQSTSQRLWRWLTIGLACATLPWLSTKYAPMSAALMAVALGRLIFPARLDPIDAKAATGASGARAAAALVLPYGLSLLGWFYFFYVTWGSPMPQAPYGALVQTELKNLIFGAPGLLFDQEYGLLPYAPVYVLAGTGLWAMWRAGSEPRRSALEIIIIFAALLGTVGAFRIWWGGSAAPSRPLTSALLLLAAPIAFAFRTAPAGTARRAAHAFLLWTSIGIAAILFSAEQGFLTSNSRDGTSSLLEYLSPRWPLWSVVPSYIHHEAFTAIAHTVCWGILAVAIAAAIRRAGPGHPGAISLRVSAIMWTGVLVAVLVMPLLPLQPPWPAANVRARAHVPLLDEFDTVTHPAAIEYAPLRVERAAALVSRTSLEVEPGLRTEPQPTRVLHNGRFSLPTGSYRVEVDWSGTRTGETVGLQIGRSGNAWQSWPVTAQPGERWTAEFSLPADAAFVGLRGTPELERVVQHVRIRPLSIVDQTHRPRTPEILAASRSAGASVFYYDDNTFQEDRGFWVRDARSTRVSIHRPDGSGPLILRVHSGPIDNPLLLSTFGWRRTVMLRPRRPEEVEVPAGTGSLITLELTASTGFVPRDVEPSSSDARPLGVWVEVVK